LKFDTGYDPSRITIPKRFKDVVTERGPLDDMFLRGVAEAYQAAIVKLVDGAD
jgi:aldehyde:ferredoxin oxidoreductase